MNNSVVPSNETGAPVGAATGGRRRGSLRKVSAKTVRRVLRSAGVKPKGRVVLKGGEDPMAATEKLGSSPNETAAPAGGRRRRVSRKTRRHKKRGLFGLRR